MTTQHTPGPWRAELTRTLGNVYADNFCIASLGDAFGQRDANARLIAAAPDLLAALRYALDVLVVTEVCENDQPQIANLRIHLRAAIAKVEGV